LDLQYIPKTKVKEINVFTQVNERLASEISQSHEQKVMLQEENRKLLEEKVFLKEQNTEQLQ
jgi:hypothetical protein